VITPEERHYLYKKILDRYDKLFEFLAHHYASDNEEKDLHQQILLHIWKGLDGFEKRSSPEWWGYRIAQNTVNSHRRATRRHNRGLEAYKETVETTMPGGRGEDQIVQDFSNSITEEEQEIFALYLSDRDYKEIAEMKRINEATLRSKISRLKDKFKQRYL
jgi:RNA polymerase sigma factor (sigma-70 family)